MSTRFFTKDNSNTLLRKFEGFFEHNPDLALTLAAHITLDINVGLV